MYNFLMVSTVFSKKQFSILSINKKEEFVNLVQDLAKIRKHLILYPCINKQNVRDIQDLIDDKTIAYLESECKRCNAISEKKLCVTNWTGLKLKDVVFIEHLHDNFFKVQTRNRFFVSDSFELYVK